MFEELLGRLIPGGAYVAIGVAVGAAFSKQLRPVAKQLLKAGMSAAEQAQAVAAEAFERGQDLVAEARFEQAQEVRSSSNGRTARPRRRSTGAAARSTE